MPRRVSTGGAGYRAKTTDGMGGMRVRRRLIEINRSLTEIRMSLTETTRSVIEISKFETKKYRMGIKLEM